MAESANCGECGRAVKVHMPRGGDGTERTTYWHKDPATGKRCRSAVSVDLVRWEG